MKNWRRIGYVSVEAVITAALILAVGFFALLNLSGTGSQLVQNGLNKLDGLNLFGTSSPGGSGGYDDNGYPDDLNVNPGDINPVSDFTFELNTEGDGYILVSYNNKTDFDVVIPREYEGLPVMSIGESAFDTDYTETPLTSVAIPNSIKELQSYAFYGNNIASVYIPGTVDVLGYGAFYWNGLTHVTFMGNVPSSIDANIFRSNDGLIKRTVLVPDNQLTAYRAIAESNLDVMPFVIYSLNEPIPTPIDFEEERYPDELNIQEGDVNPESDFDFAWNSEYNGWMITYYNNSSDKDVVIPAYRSDDIYIVSIDRYAFESQDLTSVAIPNSIVEIKEWAFSYNQLTSLIIPSSVVDIEEAAFNGNLLPQNQAYIYANPGESNTLVSYGGASGAAVIPANTDVIGKNSFRSVSLSSVEFNSGLTSIEEVAFYNNQLTTLSIPSSVTHIGCNAFGNNPGLLETSDFTYTWDSSNCGWMVSGYTNSTNKNVIIPERRGDMNAIVSIGSTAFYNKQLVTVDIPDTVVVINGSAFNTNLLASISLPENLKTIGNLAFSNNKLSTITVPDKVTTIGVGSFQSNQLTSAIIGNSVVSIGKDAFNWNILSSVTLGSSVNVIDQAAFADSKLTSIVIPDSVTRIGINAFANNLLTSVDLGENVTYIDQNAFGNNKLVNISLPDSLYSIGSWAFSSNDIASIELPDSLSYIGEWAFYGNELTSIVIPKNVYAIGTSSFRMNKLTSVTIQNPEMNIGIGAFNINKLPQSDAYFYRTLNDTQKIVSYGGSSLNAVIPEGTTIIGESAFNLSQGTCDACLTAVTIPSSVTTIEKNAFNNNRLASVTIPSGVTTIGDDAFRNNALSLITFNGPVPTTIGATPFWGNNPFSNINVGKMMVPSAYLSSYKAKSWPGINSQVILGY